MSTIYQNAKACLKEVADEAKRTTGNTDKPYIRQCINDTADDLINQFNWHAMKEKISEKKANQYSNWLSGYACNLHPKN